MLKSHFTENLVEAGCDEAGRGCLAGPVFAAAVVLPKGFTHNLMNDSKKLSEKQRVQLRQVIKEQALGWAVASASVEEIEQINILHASILAMHKAVNGLKVMPQLLLIDGNRFKPYPGISHQCIVKGDQKYLSIAAASILAKTYRDDFMMGLHTEFPVYGWNQNKGYPTMKHREAILLSGITPHHRKTFNLTGQLRLPIN
jgi:ribonuclease HII